MPDALEIRQLLSRAMTGAAEYGFGAGDNGRDLDHEAIRRAVFAEMAPMLGQYGERAALRDAERDEAVHRAAFNAARLAGAGDRCTEIADEVLAAETERARETPDALGTEGHDEPDLDTLEGREAAAAHAREIVDPALELVRQIIRGLNATADAAEMALQGAHEQTKLEGRRLLDIANDAIYQASELADKAAR